MKNALGEFEHQVLLSALRLGKGAYTAAIVLELEERTEREVAAAAVYIALRRLEDYALVKSNIRRMAEPGGKRERRYFTITSAGIDQLSTTRERLLRLWEGIEPVLEART
jgi:PadR family transcriptional regulator, regulatory protein PadR